MSKATSKKFAYTSMALAITAALDVAAQPMLEEVLVTASKREASMQDVPIAISTMNGEKIEEQGIQSLEELAIFMPNVHIAEGGAGDQLFIRGVGSGINYGFEQSVGTFIDGVYFGRGQASRSTFLDVERVEILKGPQSTLFGKNTVAGAINITTRGPSDEFEGLVEATMEPEFDGWSGTVMASGPLSDNWGARFVIKREETDGYMNNTFTGGEERGMENTVGRLVLAWTPTDTLDVSLKYETGKSEAKGRQNLVSIATDFAVDRYRAADPAFSANFGYDKSTSNIGGVRPDTDVHDSDWDIVTLTADWALGEHSIKSITGYVNYEFSNYQDSDYGPLAFLGRGRDEEHEQFTQEFLLSSPTGGNLEYLAGLYYQSEELQHDRVTDAVLSAADIGTGNLDATGLGSFEQEAETWSVFTQLTWNVSDSLRAIAGVRYSADEKEMTKDGFITDLYTSTPNTALAGIYDQLLNFSTDHFMGSNGATVCEGLAYVCTDYPDFDNKRTENHWTGDVTLQWDASDGIMAYFKVGNGYKAGGFDEANGRGLVDAEEYDDETVMSYELGAKLDLLDGRARMTMAIFQSEFEDLQVSAFDGNAGFVVGNAAESEVTGFEVDGMMAITENLTFNASLAYLDGTYKSFDDAACNEPQVQSWIADGGVRGDCKQDLSGKALQFSPEWSAHVALDYYTQLGSSMEVHMGVDAMYSDYYEVANDLDPAIAQDSFSKINARIALLSIHDTWSVAILGKNLTDEKTTTWGNDVPLAGQGFNETYFQHIDAPRSYELQVRYRF